MNETDRDQLETAAKEFAGQIGLPYFDTRPHIDIKPLQDLLTVAGMTAYGFVPVALAGRKLTLGINETTNRTQLESLKQRLSRYDVEFAFTSQFGWKRLFNRYKLAENQNVLETGNFETFSKRVLSVEPKAMLEPLAQLAYQLQASDIHIEPTAKDARIRFRVDGVLHPIINLPKERYNLLVSDLQMRAGVKWGSGEPQGGRVAITVINQDGDQTELNMRLETIPGLHGEDIVLRLFNLSQKYLSLGNLQLTKTQTNTILRATAHPGGLIMAVGPTGSGKTSTLYSILNQLNNPEVKIVTLEDPVEYELSGISQIPVRSDNQQLFLDKLRAVLREDPNIIMIGEIRDTDTAKTALQASLTGHLVLSTFHATNASAAISRLMDMINQNPLIASSIRLIIAQRLVRRLCEACKANAEPTKEQLLQIKTALQNLPESAYPSLSNLKLGRAVGCNLCHHFGYNGRLKLMELLDITPTMEAFLGGSTATTATAIEQAAVKEGMVTLLQDGIIKVLKQQTTLDEVFTQVGR